MNGVLLHLPDGTVFSGRQKSRFVLPAFPHLAESAHFDYPASIERLVFQSNIPFGILVSWLGGNYGRQVKDGFHFVEGWFL